VKGRRRFGLSMVQAASGLMVGGFGLALLGVAWGWFGTLGGLAFVLGLVLLPLGGFVYSKQPLRLLTVFFARLAFLVLLLSAGIFGFLRYQRLPAARVALDFLVVSGVVWFVLWIVARSREWPLLEMTVFPASGGGGGWSYSSGGSSGWSSSGSSSWGSSSGSGSSFSGGGGSSGGGGASGSW
jgi:uncharacterized protein